MFNSGICTDSVTQILIGTFQSQIVDSFRSRKTDLLRGNRV